MWKTAVLDAIERLSGHPGSPVEWWCLISLAALTGVFTLGGMLKSLSDHGQGFFVTALFSALGITLTIGVLAACYLFLPAAWVQRIDQGWLLLMPIVVAGLVLVVPLLCLVWRYPYFEVLLSWMVSLLATAMVIFTISVLFDVLYRGSKSVDRIHRLNQDTERVIDQR